MAVGEVDVVLVKDGGPLKGSTYRDGVQPKTIGLPPEHDRPTV